MPSPSKKLWVAVATCLLGFASRNLEAQTASDLISVLPQVYVDSVSGLAATIPNPGQTLRYNENFDAELSTIGTVSSAVVNEIGGFPIGSSSGGFTYFFDPTTGAAVRSSPSFGPAFAERPLTSGRGKLNVGLTYLHRSFSKIEGEALDGGGWKYYSNLLLPSGNTVLNVDLIESTFNVKLKSDTATFFATYGVMNNLDVSLAVPIQRIEIAASVTSQLVRFGPSSQALPVPAFTSSKSQTATGVGDLALRAKYNLFNGNAAAVAAGLDLRLPTGNENNLLGTGRTRTKIYGAVASKMMPRLFPHANLGYTFKSKENADSLFVFGSEFSYTAGTEYVVNPRVTVVGDIVGRSLADEGRLQRQSRTAPLDNIVATYRGVQTNVPAETRSVNELVFVPGLRLNSAFATIGAKFSPASTLIVSAHLLFPMTSAGLKSRVAPVVGVDYTF